MSVRGARSAPSTSSRGGGPTGRTLPTYRNVVEELVADWDGFRRALRAEDRERFDEMMARARDVASAGGHEPRLDPAESVFISILLGHEKELAELRRRSGER
jgi:hypothetical protein